VWNPRQGEHNDAFRYIIEEPGSVTTQYATHNEVAEHCPTQGSREVTPSSGKEAPSDIAIHNAKEGSKKR
jgi:hypothetical protein